MLGVPVNIALAVVAVSLLIVVHEFGHLLGAKAVGMRVEVFSIGFWKRLVGVKLGETDYRLSLVPLGGYLKVAGESPEEGEEGQGKPDEYWSKTPRERAVFIGGGVALNFFLAVFLFMLAFAVGVPFTAAEVGQALYGSPAWQAGLKPGDRITAINGQPGPVFEDLVSAVLLSDGQPIELGIEREGRLFTFVLGAEYEARAGYRAIGIAPTVEPVVTGLQEVGAPVGRCPAKEAGVELGDVVLAVNDKRVMTGLEFDEAISRAGGDEVTLQLKRGGQVLTVSLRPEPMPRYMVGISGVGTVVEALEDEGQAEQAGLRLGDRIASVNGVAVSSIVDLQDALGAAGGQARMLVMREEAESVVTAEIADARVAGDFVSSALFRSSTALCWVQEGGPAWQAGLRAGDTIVTAGGKAVESWQDIIYATEEAIGKGYVLRWRRPDGEMFEAHVTPVTEADPQAWHAGILMDRLRTETVRYGALGAVREGVKNTMGKLTEAVLMLRGFATRELSPRHMGGIVTIAYASYRAAQEGIGKLLYMTAVISAALALFNLLPIPVLDGGHLLFLGIEQVRGKRLSERLMNVLQGAGFVLLMMLVVYVTRNDIMRLFQLG